MNKKPIIVKIQGGGSALYLIILSLCLIIFTLTLGFRELSDRIYTLQNKVEKSLLKRSP